MAFYGNFFTLFAIYVALCIAATDGVRTQQWTHNFENSVFQQDRSLLTSPGQVYGNCDSQVAHADENKHETSCKIAMENADAAIDSPDHVRMCNFTLPIDHNSSYRLDEIIAITENRAVLIFNRLSSQILFVLNFVNCTVANSYRGKNFMSVHAPSKEKFDVIVLKHSNPEETFRIIFDNNGNITSSEQSWFKRDINILAAADSPTKGRLVIDVINRFVDDSVESAVRINAIANDGSIETLKEYPMEDRGFFSLWESFVESTTFNFVSLCARLNSNTPMKCSQFDLDGNLKFETEIALDEYFPAHSFRLHNLPHGGFLLFIFKCRGKVKPVCVLREQSFYVKKINAAGQSVGTLKVNYNHNELDVKMGVMHVFESDKKEVCLSNVRGKFNDWNLILDVVCLKEDDFSGEITWPTY